MRTRLLASLVAILLLVGCSKKEAPSSPDQGANH